MIVRRRPAEARETVVGNAHEIAADADLAYCRAGIKQLRRALD